MRCVADGSIFSVEHNTLLEPNETPDVTSRSICAFLHSLCRSCNWPIDGEERDHKEQPYSERQYVLIRKQGSSAENLHKTDYSCP